MTRDGRRTAKLCDPEIIAFVEKRSQETGKNIFETVEDIIRRYMHGEYDKRQKNIILKADVVGSEYLRLIDSMLLGGHIVTAKKIENGVTQVVVE